MIRTLQVGLSPATLDALKGASYALYGFQVSRYGPSLTTASSAGFGGGYPLVWFRNTAYLQTTSINWDDDIQAFVAEAPVRENAVVQMGTTVATAIGQTVTVSVNGGLSPGAGGEGGQGVVSILNAGTTPWTCGLARAVGGSTAGTCAFPLYGSGLDMITPTNQVLVMFAIDLLTVGMAVTAAYGPGLLVDFKDQTQRAVTFDIDKGWSAAGATWATPVPAQTDLGPLLIIPPASHGGRLRFD